MKFNDAISLFGRTLNVDLSDKRFLVTLVDPEISDQDILVRIELSFLTDLSELQPGSTGGQFESLKSGRLSAAVLFDWKLINEHNGQEFLRFCQQWDPAVYYAKGSQKERVLINKGILTANITEFVGPSTSCAGMTQVRIQEGQLSFGGASREAKNFIKSLIAAAPSKTEDILF